MNIFKDFKHTAREFYSGRTFIAFDTETTGLKASEEYVIELGAVKFNYQGIIDEPFNVLIKPPVSIPQYITEINNISNEMVADAPIMKDVIPAFMEYIGDRKAMLVAHNAPFDLKFLEYEFERHGKRPVNNETVDTLPLARWAYPGLIQLAEKGQYKLQSLAKRFDIEVKSAHRACDDARVCMELFKRIIKDTLTKQKDYEIPTGQMSLF